MLTAGYQNLKAEFPGARVCSVCIRNRAHCLVAFGTASAIDADWIGAAAIVEEASA